MNPNCSSNSSAALQSLLPVWLVNMPVNSRRAFFAPTADG